MDIQQVLLGCIEEILLQKEDFQEMLAEVKALRAQADAPDMQAYGDAAIEYFETVLNAIDRVSDHLVPAEMIERPAETIYLFGDAKGNQGKHGGA